MINPFAAAKVRNAYIVWESSVICHAVSDAAANGLIRFYDKERLRSESKKKWPFTTYAAVMLPGTEEYPYPLVYFTSFCKTFLSFSFNFLIYSACPFIYCMHVWFMWFCFVCLWRHSTTQVWGGCVSECMCLCLCCVLCEALLSNICVWIWKPNEDKLSVIQYLWECLIGIIIVGGWNFVSTLRLWLSFMRML